MCGSKVISLMEHIVLMI